MRYKLFGHSGLRVSELSLGTLTFGEEMGWGVGIEESRKVFDAYVAAGGNFFDTANAYNGGTSEKFLGEMLGSERDRFVVASKFSLNMRAGDANAGGNHRKNIKQSLEASLRRLDTDYLDLYWLHQWDFTTPVEEIMRALDDLVSAGKILYIGISDTPAWIVSRANMLAELRGWTAFAGIQIEYSLIERSAERELLPMAQSLDLAVALWGVAGQGVLTGKYLKDPQTPDDTKRAAVTGHRLTERNLAVARLVQSIADSKGCSSTQVAINWVRQRGQQMIPIIGNRTLEQLRQNLACLDYPLSDDEMTQLDAAGKIELGFPHEFLARPRLIEQRFGGIQTLLDNHRPIRHM
jgi:aryl-alcohol dehydrogenase-like predicted oxidoreductase